MQLSRIRLYVLRIPLVAALVMSFGVIDTRYVVIIELQTADGLHGFGEAPVIDIRYSYETAATCFHVLRDFIAPEVLGKHFGSVEEFRQRYDFIRGHNIAKAAIEAAFWDIMAQYRGLPLASFIGGVREYVPVGATIQATSTVRDLLTEVEARLALGYKRIKLRIRPGWDLEPLKQVRRSFGDIPLMADAEASYDPADIELFQAMDSYGLMMIEQPFGAGDLWYHAKLQASIQTPICLDESINDRCSAKAAIEMGSCRVVNIKPWRVGGLLEAIAIHNICANADVPVWCGQMLETGIGQAFGIALASLPNFCFPADMSLASSLLLEDLVHSPHTVTDGLVRVPGIKGAGFSVATERLRKYLLQQVEIA